MFRYLSLTLLALMLRFAGSAFCLENYSPVSWVGSESMLELGEELSPYFVEADFTVEAGKVLLVRPGVKIYFNKNASLIINGRLVAEGSRAKRIVFDSYYKNFGWNGMLFDNAQKQNMLAYCDIKNGRGFYSDIAVKNKNYRTGGAVTISGSNVVMEFCDVSENTADKGGAVYAKDSELFLRGCYFTKNKAKEGGAFYLVMSNAVLAGNSITKNSANNLAGAIIAFGSKLNLARNRIVSNRAGMEGGIYSEDSDIYGKFNNISRNSGKAASSVLIAEVLRELPAIVQEEREKIAKDIEADSTKLAKGAVDVKPAATAQEAKANLVASLKNIKGTVALTSKYSPYIIRGDIMVNEGAELLIEAGVALEMAENASIIIKGKLTARGKKSNMIYINSADPQKRWRNLVFAGSKADNNIEWVVFNGGGGRKVGIGGVDTLNGGGAAAVVDSKVTFNNCSFELNKADFGGAVFAENSEVYFTNNSFQKNKAQSEGGAVYVRNSVCKIIHNDFFDNVSGLDGAAVLLWGLSPDIFDNNIYNNRSANGGAVFQCRGARPKIRNNHYLKNSARDFAIEPAQGDMQKRVVKPIFQK